MAFMASRDDEYKSWMRETPHSANGIRPVSYNAMKDHQVLSACEPGSSPTQPQTNPPHRILVVDDDCDIRDFNAEVLARCGYEVDTAENGADAWDTMQLNSYDLMVTDNNMPKMSGVELLMKLHAAHMSLPVLMATGSLPKAEFMLHPYLQPAATLLKPYTVQELLETVRTILKMESIAAPLQLLAAHDFHDFSHSNITQVNERAAAEQNGPANSAQRILVVDKDSDLRLLYTDALSGHGYKVDEVEDGGAAWETLQAKDYNLLITEHDLPKLTGIQLIRKLRAAHMALPVVMAATTLPTDELHRDVSLQLAATLEKPFAIDALVNTVRSVLYAPAAPGLRL